jgi:lipid II:glycine glycyltransferase (peptidoglycan interpeptide bridge formation enzyme)
MYVRELKADEHKGFFDLALEKGNIFTSRQWTAIYGKQLLLMGLFSKKADQLIGGFCMYTDRKFGITYLRTPPFNPHISVFYVDRSTNPANVSSFRKKIIFAIADFVTQSGKALVNLSFPPTEQDMQPMIWSKLNISLRYTYQVQLNQDEKKILGNFSPERRNDLTKAAKDGVTVTRAENFVEVEDMINKTYAANNLRTYPDILKKIFSEFANADNSCGFLAHHNGKPIACSFIVYNAHMAYYILGGYDRENSHHGAGALCIWEAIKEMKQRNVKVFDFEGSMVPAIESFFRGFGGTITPFYQVKKTPLVNIYRTWG